MSAARQAATAASSGCDLPLIPALSGFLHRLAKPAHLLVAVSGGSDSTGLLVGLHSIRSLHPDIRICAATIDHALRPEAAAEARAVATLCADLGIFHMIRRWEGEKPDTGLSAAARAARYHLLSRVADEIGATAIVTGHTLDDQIETVVMRAGRQDHLSPLQLQAPGRSEGDVIPTCFDIEAPGLAGMAPATLLDARHWILRPLLETRRADIRAFLTHGGHGWIDDPSNVDPHYERVRIRRTLADQPAIDPAAIAGAGRARGRLAQAAADWLAAHATLQAGVVATIAAGGLSAEPATMRHALGMLTATLGGRTHGFSRQTGDRVMAFVCSGRPGRMTAGRVVFDRRRDALHLVREDRDLPEFRLAPGETALWDNRFRVENHTAEAVFVGPGKAPGNGSRQGRADGCDLPPRVAGLAVRAVPEIAGQAQPGLTVTPHIAPFDHFLSAFDLPLAGRIAALLGRKPYLLPPV